MEYEMTMEMAGAEVICFNAFGSYQGDWWAKVKYEGKVFWVKGSYGSCSGCDAFQSEFSYKHHEHKDNDYYDPLYDGIDENCSECLSVKERLIAFGKEYLDYHLSQEEAEEIASRDIEWDMDAEQMLAYLKENKITGDE